MKHTRELTAEERRLWAQTTRHDRRFRPLSAEEHAAGEEAIIAAFGDTLAPPIAEPKPALRRVPVAPLLVPLDRRARAQLLRRHQRVDRTLDLHGMGRVEAYQAVRQCLARAAQEGLRHLVIVTGKGTRDGAGVLRASLPHWLNEPVLRGLIIGIAHGAPHEGGDGMMHVLLRRGLHEPLD